MYLTAQQIHAAMAGIVEAPGYPLLQHYKDDFYKHDLQNLVNCWSVNARAIWVVTPNGTHLNFVGHHPRQIDEVDATLHTGYANFEIYLLQAKGITRITSERALAEAKKLDFHLKPGGHVTDALGNTVAYMSITPTGSICRRTTNVHFEPGIAFTGSPTQLVALRNIAIQASISEVQTLFMAVERITVGDALWTKTGLVKVQCEPDDQTKSVIFSSAEFENEAKGFYSQRKKSWSTLHNASLYEAQNARVPSPIGSRVISLKEARFIVAQSQLCTTQ